MRKITAGKLVFGDRQIYMACGSAVGIVAALLLKETPGISDLAGGFMHAFPAHFSFPALRNAVLWQLLPAVLIALSGGMLFGRALCTALLAVRCMLDGFAIVCFYRAVGEHDAIFYIVWIYLAVFEALGVLCMNTMARLAEMYLSACLDGKGRPALGRYLVHEGFYCGLIFVLYLMRGTVVLLFG